MKYTPITILVALLALSTGARAETKVTLSGVHLCCKGCINAVEKAASSVAGAAAVCDKDARTAVVTAPDNATAQKAVDAIVAAGFFGASGDPAVKVSSTSGASDAKVTSATVSGVHLCCGKCATAANDAAKSVPGVQGSDAAKGSTSFKVTGDFSAKELASALEKAGLSGKIAN
jgi:periplasmic mercuric ion binding protein